MSTSPAIPSAAAVVPLVRRAIDSYADRTGYSETFLGSKFRVRLPSMSKAMKSRIAEVKSARRPGVLDYTHFSVMLNKVRKMCFYAVVNIDGKQSKRTSKDGIWALDPRVADEMQTGGAVYEKNDLDRGHMVRRLDPVWGDSFELGNFDTFHFTNACPQVHKFNDGIWGELEDYLLENADVKDLKLTVFTGPIFGDEDREYRDTLLPSRFWKVAVMVTGTGSNSKMASAGFMLSQDELLTPFDFPLGPIPKVVKQVPIADIEKLTGMKFGTVTKADAMAKPGPAAVSFSIEPEAIELKSLDQVVIPRK